MAYPTPSLCSSPSLKTLTLYKRHRRQYSGPLLSCHLRVKSWLHLEYTTDRVSCVSISSAKLAQLLIEAYVNLLYGRVVELSTGVICGCVPFFPALIRRHNIQFSRIPSLLYKFVMRTSTKSKCSSDLPLHVFDRVDSKDSKPQDPKVETRVLGSIQGYVGCYRETSTSPTYT